MHRQPRKRARRMILKTKRIRKYVPSPHMKKKLAHVEEAMSMRPNAIVGGSAFSLTVYTFVPSFVVS